MQASHIAHFDEHARFHVREDRGDYHTDADSNAGDTAADPAEPLYRAQGLVGDALNLAGLLLASLEDQGDTRAMQIESAVSVIEEKLAEAFRQLGEYEMRAMRPRFEPDA